MSTDLQGGGGETEEDWVDPCSSRHLASSGRPFLTSFLKSVLKAFCVLSSVLDGRNTKEAAPFPPGLYNLVVKSKK